MDVLIIASEAAPLATAGGLGDVMGSLPAALTELGCRVSVVLPAYRAALEQIREWEVRIEDLPVAFGKWNVTGDILLGQLDRNVPIYLVRRDEFFDRNGIYGSDKGEYFDNLERYIFFSHSIPALCSALSFQPDILLANDWQTGLVMVLLDHGALPGPAGIFAIHNMGYLGLVPSEKVENLGLPDRYYRTEGLEFYGRMSLLKAGIVYGQKVVTVSPAYAQEIQTPEFGFGLDGLMRSIKERLHGILNGADYQVWNPETDKYLAANYSPQDTTGKALCKEDLLKMMGLGPGLMDRPVIGMVTRLVEQKGCSLLVDAADELFAMGSGLVVLGSGDDVYEHQLQDLQSRYPDRFGLKLGFDNALAHKIIAGSDIFLIPSLYEPCGLTQMYSLKYGTIPLVRATGGLKDTVIDPSENTGKRTGFKFDRFQAADLAEALKRALKAFEQPDLWQEIIREAMAQDFSWRRSAKKYLRLFERTLAGGDK